MLKIGCLALNGVWEEETPAAFHTERKLGAESREFKESRMPNRLIENGFAE